MGDRQAGGPSVPEVGLQRACEDGTVTPCKFSAACKVALSCFMVDTSKPTDLLTELGSWHLGGHKKLLEGPKPPLG